MKEVLYCQLGDQVPEVIRLLPLGEVALADGRQPFQVTQESLARILAAWRRRGHDLVIDYEHQSLSGQEAPAAGWIKELWIGTDGLYARVAWTERARSYLARKEYRYFSPVVQLNEAREVTDLLQVALTNCPAMSHLEPLVLQEQRSEGQNNGGVAEDRQIGRREEETFAKGGQMIERLRTIFGLAEDAGEPEILARAIALRQRQEEGGWEAPEEVLTTLGLERGCQSQELVEKVTALQSEAERLRRELAALRGEHEAEKAARLIQEALITKKTTPAELDQAEGRLRRLAKDDPEFFRALILSRRENWAVPGRLFQAEAASPALDDAELKICEAFGLAPEAFLQKRQQLEQGE
jgi:phage I-like protein